MKKDLHACIRGAIQSALRQCTPLRNPFLVLREAGVVAEIRGQVRAALPPNKKRCSATIFPASVRSRFDWGAVAKGGADEPSVQVDRVQLEMKVISPELFAKRIKKEDREDKDGRGRIDLVVLNDEGVEICCAANGPGDIIASVPNTSVLACVEVKASPSVDPREVALYGKDIDRLLRFVEQAAQAKEPMKSAFFVLLDKSSGDWFGKWKQGKAGSPIAKAASRIAQWAGDKPLEDVLPLGKFGGAKVAAAAHQKLVAFGIDLTNKKPKGVPFVEIIFLGNRSASEKTSCPSVFAIRRLKNKKP